MLVLSEITMTLSSGTAGYESGLSRMNLQKTNIHTPLSNQSLDITRIAINGDPIHKFKTEDHVNSWIANRQGKRHLEGHKTPSSKKTKL